MHNHLSTKVKAIVVAQDNKWNVRIEELKKLSSSAFRNNQVYKQTIGLLTERGRHYKIIPHMDLMQSYVVLDKIAKEAEARYTEKIQNLIITLRVVELLEYNSVYDEITSDIEDLKFLSSDNFDQVIWDAYAEVIAKKDFGNWSSFDPTNKDLIIRLKFRQHELVGEQYVTQETYKSENETLKAEMRDMKIKMEKMQNQMNALLQNKDPQNKY